MKAKSSDLEVVLRNGKPVAVILGIEAYRKMLERLEDTKDLYFMDFVLCCLLQDFIIDVHPRGDPSKYLRGCAKITSHFAENARAAVQFKFVLE